MKIALLGCSGSGKTTLAKRLEDELGYPVIELDSFFHLPGWQGKSSELMRDEVSAAISQSEQLSGGWIVDGNYLSKLGDLFTSRADIVIWFNLPKSEVMSRIIKRSFRRAFTREELWNGNRESALNLLRWSPEKNIIRWAWTQHGSYEEQLRSLANEAAKDRKQLWIEIKGEKDLLTAINYLASINL
jgi:adenylate kinase family enzyme